VNSLNGIRVPEGQTETEELLKGQWIVYLYGGIISKYGMDGDVSLDDKKKKAKPVGPAFDAYRTGSLLNIPASPMLLIAQPL